MNKLKAYLSDNDVPFLENEPMKLHTSFKTGGAAKLFVCPDNEKKLKLVLEYCAENRIKPFILGNGSNLLVSDDGIDGVVIHIGNGIDEIRLLDETTIEAFAGARLSVLCKYALSKGLSGLEFAFGIPGSVGGAAFMNAGAYGGEMKDVVSCIKHIDSRANFGELSGAQLDFGYRKSAYTSNGFVITSVILKLEKKDKAEIEEKMNDLLQRRKDKQPLDYPSAGSVFKRPEGYFAGALIEQSGLKGKQIGGARVSEKHAGFIINYDNATTCDIKELIKYCKDAVFEKFGVELETEIKMI